jgi:hypothetical protein
MIDNRLTSACRELGRVCCTTIGMSASGVADVAAERVHTLDAATLHALKAE